MNPQRKKRLRLIAVSLGALLAVFVIFILVERIRGARALSARLSELRTKGERLGYAELIPARPAAGKNAFPGLLALTNQLEELSEALRSTPPSMKLVAPARATVSWQLQHWPGTDQKTNSWATLEPHLEKIRALQGPAHAALQLSGFDSGFNYQKGLVEFELPPIVLVKRLASSLALAVSDALRRGQTEEAVASLRDLIRLVELEKDERLIISQLVRLTCADMAVRRTWELLQAPDCTDAQLAAVQSAWLPMDFPLDMSRALEMERALTLDFYDQLRHSRAARDAQLTLWRKVAIEGLTPEASGWMEYVNLPLWRVAWSEQDELRALNRWQGVIEIERIGRAKSWNDARALFKATETADEDHLASLDSASSRGKLNWYDQARFVFSGLDFSVGDTIVRRVLGRQTEQHMAIAAIALRRYELRHHQPAPDLAALVPEFLPAVPRDLMDGQPLRYRGGPGGGFLLYSVGDDGKDDGGDASRLAGMEFGKESSSSFWGGRDAVWPTAATPEEIKAFEENKSTR